MDIRKACILAVSALNLSLAANLQTQDLFFFSTHKSPLDVVGDDKNAYVLTEGGVLMYDYRRQTWVDNLAPSAPVVAIRYSSSRSRVYLQLQGGRLLEYNSTFRRLTDASHEDFLAANASGSGADLNGLTLDGNNFFLGDAIRDKYMRRAPIRKSLVFDYDNLWVLTEGLGLYYGSQRRKSVSNYWFGLDDPAAQVIYHEGGRVWFGSCRTDLSASAGLAGTSNGSLVMAKADLSGWKIYPAQLETGFGDGCIHDIKAWRNFIWLATEKGVVRHDPVTGQFRTFSRIQGGSNPRVNYLHVHEDQLFAASEDGVAYVADPQSEFQSLEAVNQGGVPVYQLISKGKDLWAATRLGLFVHQAGGWKDLKAVSGKDVPEATLIPVPSVAYHDTSLFWINGNKIMVKAKKQQPKILFERDQPIRLQFEGDILFVAFYSGITAYDLRKSLWTDFRLQDGIPGTRVLSLSIDNGKLWIGTDAGVERINYKAYLP
jgi:ligand-binding sensor domain-containing protein